MINTTLCYIEKDNKYLMLHRIKKENDLNKDKWIGIGGKFEDKESPEDCLLREVYEETGLTVTQITGENSITCRQIGEVETVSLEPFCVTQNMSGAYSIVLLTFICSAEGTLLDATDETKNIRWYKVDEVKRMIDNNPNQFFFMHSNALKKYLSQ